jgi:hypothetical protein
MMMRRGYCIEERSALCYLRESEKRISHEICRGQRSITGGRLKRAYHIEERPTLYYWMEAEKRV